MPGKIALIHLSDMHLRPTEELDESKVNSLVNVINADAKDCSHIFFIVTGDIAFSGSSEDYKIAEKVFDRLRQSVQKECSFMICPGNHDCNLVGDNYIRDTIIDKVISENVINPSAISQLTLAQNNFFGFRNKYMATIDSETKISSKFKSTIDGRVVGFNVVNSGWIAKIRSRPGEIVVPLDELGRLSDVDIAILIMHHTPNWFHQDLQRNLRKALTESYDIVFTGHEHDPSDYAITSHRSMQSTSMIEGGNLSPFTNNDSSAFNVVVLDTDSRKYRLSEYAFKPGTNGNSGIYRCEDSTSDKWISLAANGHLATSTVSMDENFILFLEDPGAPYKHPAKDKLNFNDIFVSPDLREISDDVKHIDGKGLVIQSFSKIIERVNGHLIIIEGPEKSGKTSLCKALCFAAIEKSMVPIYINGINVKSSTASDIENLIIKSFRNQYPEEDVDLFKQLESDRKVIILDDFHRSPLLFKQKINCLRYLHDNYNRVWAFVDNSVLFQEILRHNTDGAKLSAEIKVFSIIPFGHKLRYELVQKWHSISGDIYEDKERYSKVDATLSMLKILAENNLVPPYPFYLYTAISATNAMQPTNIAESTYGHYYTTLLTIALSKVTQENEEIDLRINYLTELAYHIYDTRKSVLTDTEARQFHSFYCRSYSLPIDFGPFIDQLVQSTILGKTDSVVYFKYKYFYYYFLARHLFVNIGENRIQEIITDFCKTLHVDASANTIMFLTHLCKNPIIIETIVSESQCIFKDKFPIKLEDDAKLVNELIGEAEHVEYIETETDEFRQELLETKDIHEGTLERDYDFYSGREITHGCEKAIEDGPEKLMLSLGAMHKTLDIIGLILKSYYGSLKAHQKIMLCQEGFALPLRALADYFSFLSDNRDALIDEFNILLAKRKKSSLGATERDKVSKQYIFNLSEGICFSFIKKAATSLGNGNLRLTYSDVLESMPYYSSKLIDIAIKIDTYRDFPLDELRELAKEIKGSIISYSVLRDLVAFYMYMYPVDYKLRQKICSILDMSFHTQSIRRGFALEKGLPVV